MSDVPQIPENPLASLQLEGVLEIESDGTPQGTKVCIDGKQLALLQTVRFQVTPEGVVVQLTAVAAKAKLKGRIVSLAAADPAPPASAPAAGG